MVNKSHEEARYDEGIKTGRMQERTRIIEILTEMSEFYWSEGEREQACALYTAKERIRKEGDD